MNLHEEDLNHELGKRLRQKFDGFNAPVEDKVRNYVFDQIAGPPYGIYLLLAGAAMLLIAGLIYWTADHDAHINGKSSPRPVYKNRVESTKAPDQQQSPQISWQMHPVPKKEKRSETPVIRIIGAKSTVKDEIPAQNKEVVGNHFLVEKDSVRLTRNSFVDDSSETADDHKDIIYAPQVERTGGIKNNSRVSEAKVLSMDLRLIRAPDITGLVNPSGALSLPDIIQSQMDQDVTAVASQRISAIFSAAMLQGFQTIYLSRSGAERAQNIQFAPAFTSRSLAYRLKAGIEIDRTQFLVSYGYMRNWNAYEIGTNRTAVKRDPSNVYTMTTLGDAFIEDERLHSIGLSVNRRIPMPQAILKGYFANLGLEYTRLMPTRQDMVWGHFGFLKQITVYRGKLEMGPCLQYSFTQRLVSQHWKSRPYQIGISVGVKIK